MNKRIEETDLMIEYFKEYKFLMDKIIADNKLSYEEKKMCIKICECILDSYDYL